MKRDGKGEIKKNENRVKQLYQQNKIKHFELNLFFFLEI